VSPGRVVRSITRGRLDRGAEGLGGSQPPQEGSTARFAQVDPREGAGQLPGRLEAAHRDVDPGSTAIAGNGCVPHGQFSEVLDQSMNTISFNLAAESGRAAQRLHVNTSRRPIR
jgi:hypothetical protein